MRASILAEITGLAALAIGQPLLDLLARHPDFLAVHGVEGARVVLLAGWIAFGPGLALGLPGALLVGRAARGWLILGRTILVAALALQLLQRWPVESGWLPVLVAVAIGGSYALLGAREPRIAQVMAWSALAPLLFAGWFVWRSDAGLVMTEGPPPAIPADTNDRASHPVLLVIFDALPTSSLLDAGGDIDAARYPAFATLRRDGIWYPRNTTVADVTLKAVPAILTGRLAREDARPLLTDHPRNLFTLFAASRPVEGFESLTRLCPDEFAHGAARVRGWGVTLRDLGIVYLHHLLPRDLRGGLPPIHHGWGNFAGGEESQGAAEKKQQFQALVGALGVERPAALYVLHNLLPHDPFQLFPSGRAFSPDGSEPSAQGDYTGIRDDDEWAALHSFQRHLFQVGATDRLLGELIARLRELGVYDDALLIVTADHGVSFRNEQFGRWYSQSTAPDILAVPLFVKLPGNLRAGDRDERDAETVDIVPTIVDALALDLDWSFDGRSLLADPVSRPVVRGLGHHGEFEIERAKIFEDRSTLDRKLEWFGDGGDPLQLYRTGPEAGWLGRRVEELLAEGETSPLQLRVLRPAARFVSSGANRYEAEVVGFAQREHARQDFPPIAVALDGRIAALTRTYATTSRALDAVWSALLPDPWLDDGPHSIEVYWIVDGKLRRPGAMTELPSFVGLPLGRERLVGVEETGFRRHRPHGNEDFRWTDGPATLRVPLRPGELPRSLRLKIAATREGGSQVELRLGDERIFSERVPAEGCDLRIPLAAREWGDSILLRLDSEVFVREDDVEAGGARPLGVALEGIWLLR